ncbi:MAG: FtsW/RodA/SpoVE family cell cycle protein, partial [Actinomycetia bacterium]|nr:FtsW/RodA/SpoVE family cell cycle protein [Actinomycetes bacterium]
WFGDDAALATERVLKVAGWIGMTVSIVLLAAVVFTPLGVERNGNRAWLDLGPLEIQPSEFAKLSLVVWSAAVFAARQRSLDRPARLLMPYLPVSGVVLGLVALQKDLGTMTVVAVIVVLQLWFVGAPGKIMAGLFAVGTVGAGALVFFEVVVKHSMTHVCRVAVWSNQMLGTHLSTLSCGESDQPANAVLGMASGGWWGVGLGASRQKWGGLYNGAQTDYILAVLGEEWGLIGMLIVLALFCALGYAGLRVALRSDSLFRRVAAAGLTAWIVVQAGVNVLVALRLMPVAGVPLPFLSYGGSGLIAALLGVGILMALARCEPAAVAVLTHSTRARPRLTGVVAPARG